MNIDKDKIYVYVLTIFVIVAILSAEFYFSAGARDMRVYYYIFSVCMSTWIIALPKRFDKIVLLMFGLQLFLALNIVFEIVG
ncbi:ABC-type multidrug transport system permease subunit [Peptoniphilus olsenii]|uniref:ABC-type multidrug transport system permease subunit n=1 Tax=Peptoniphilus olsenii TaxID=411570 RepID=A0ABV2JBU4_9FIRM